MRLLFFPPLEKHATIIKASNSYEIINNSGFICFQAGKDEKW